jgi:hypothetical protein
MKVEYLNLCIYFELKATTWLSRMIDLVVYAIGLVVQW